MTETVHRQRWCGGTLDESLHHTRHESPEACDSGLVFVMNDETVAAHLQLMVRDIFGSPPASDPSVRLVLGSVVRASCVAPGLHQALYCEVE